MENANPPPTNNPHLDDDSDDGVVLNELEEYGKMQVSSKKHENWTLNKVLEPKDVINGYFYNRILYKKLSAYDLELLGKETKPKKKCSYDTSRNVL
ncbi:hypothetical protein Tco_0077716 [Tanacetum coccineum]